MMDVSNSAIIAAKILDPIGHDTFAWCFEYIGEGTLILMLQVHMNMHFPLTYVSDDKKFICDVESAGQ